MERAAQTRTGDKSSPTEAMASDAFVVLERAVTQESVVHGRWPTASRVRIVMKDLTYDGFAPARLGFKRFRDFLQAAEAAGVVDLDPSNAGDILVALPGESMQPVKAPRRARIRKDLWTAALDWTRGVEYYFDLAIDRPVMLPSEPVLMEPERVQLLRKRLNENDAGLVKIERSDISTQVGWMHEFASTLPAGELRSLLGHALSTDKPAKNFAAILREWPGEQTAWFDLLTAKVRGALEAWRNGDPRLADLRLESLHQSAASKPEPEHDAIASTAARSPRQGKAAPFESPGSTTKKQSAEDELRLLLHRAIDRMPEAELRAIRLPVGYMLGD